MGSRALIVVDAQESPMPAFNYYFKHMHRRENHIIVLHVEMRMPRSRSASPAFPRREGKENFDKILRTPKRLNQYESEYVESMICNKASYKVRVLDGGMDARQISQIAHDENADFIIVIDDRPRRTTLKRIMSAPVVDCVLRTAGIPVTVVPQPPYKL